jgi:hypothetical protein
VTLLVTSTVAGSVDFFCCQHSRSERVIPFLTLEDGGVWWEHRLTTLGLLLLVLGPWLLMLLAVKVLEWRGDREEND